MRRGTVTRRAVRWPGGRPDHAGMTVHAEDRWAERGGPMETGWAAADAFRRTQFAGAVAGGLAYAVGPWVFLVRARRGQWRVVTVVDRRVPHASPTGAALAAAGLARPEEAGRHGDP